MDELAEVLGIDRGDIVEFETILNVRVPVLTRLNLAQSDQLRLASELLAERKISQRGYYGRLFAMYALHRKASHHFSYDQLAELELSEEQHETIKLKIDKIFKELDIWKKNQEKQREIMKTVFQQIDEDGDDSKNEIAQETSSES